MDRVSVGHSDAQCDVQWDGRGCVRIRLPAEMESRVRRIRFIRLYVAGKRPGGIRRLVYGQFPDRAVGRDAGRNRVCQVVRYGFRCRIEYGIQCRIDGLLRGVFRCVLRGLFRICPDV